MNSTIVTQIQNNKGKLVGKTIGGITNTFEVEGEKFFEGKIEVSRLSQTADILPYTISEKLVRAYNLDLNNQTEVAFLGELRSYNRVIDGKSRLILSFFVKEVRDIGGDEEGINDLSLTGYICKEPIYRTTPFNRQICDILLAVNRPAFNKSDYIPCILWGRNAKFVQSLKVGTKVSLSGRIQSRNYKKETLDGQILEKTAYEVSCQKIIIEEKIENSESFA